MDITLINYIKEQLELVELKVSRNDISTYLLYMEKAGMIGQLRDETGGMRSLGKTDKVYLDNTNLIYALSGDNGDILPLWSFGLLY